MGTLNGGLHNASWVNYTYSLYRAVMNHHSQFTVSLCPSNPWYPYMQEAAVLQPPEGWLSKMATDFVAQLQQQEFSATFSATVLKGHFCPNQIFQFCIVDLKADVR